MSSSGVCSDFVPRASSLASVPDGNVNVAAWRFARGADSFGPPDGVGARSHIQDILDGAVAILLLEMSAAEFIARHAPRYQRRPTPRVPVSRAGGQTRRNFCRSPPRSTRQA